MTHNIRSAATAANTTPTTVQAWLKRGWLKGEQLPNGRWLIRDEDLADLRKLAALRVECKTASRS